MQEPGAYTAQIDRSFRVPRPLHRSSRGQPNITNRPGESVVFLPFCGAAVLLPMPPFRQAGFTMPMEAVAGLFSLEMHA